MDVSEDVEKVKFYNFLKHYDLSEHRDSFSRHGVHKLSHLKHTTDEDLKEIGLRRPEIARLNKKMEENFSTFGKFKKRLSRKEHQFDGSVVTVAASEFGNTLGLPNLIGSDQIQLLEKIGEGAHGSVFKANVSLNGKKMLVAAKCIEAANESSVHSQFMKEAESMIQLNHHHIIKLYGISIGTPLMIIEELAPLGNLNVFLRNSPEVHLGKLYTYLLQVASAMCYLEAKKVIHRDIATRNVLLITEDHVKLSDFGLARKLTESSDYKLTRTNVPLPTAWMSPEAINDGVFSTASDVFSYGVFVWELFSKGEKPWGGRRTIEIKDRLETGERLRQPPICPSKLYQLLNECWTLDPKRRPTFSELLKKLHEPQYRPEVALVTIAHYLEGELQLKEGDLLFVLDKRRKDLWVGMTLEGEIGSFQKDCVTCDSMRMKEQHGDDVIQFDPNTQARNYFVNSDQTRKDDSVDDVASGIQLNHYETRDNNPGVVDIGIIPEDIQSQLSNSISTSDQESPYIRMKSGQSILDMPTKGDLPPPIAPTAEALQDLMILSETKNVSIYSDIDQDNDVESTYCVVQQGHFDNPPVQQGHFDNPPPVPPRKTESNPDSQSFKPILPPPRSHDLTPIPHNEPSSNHRPISIHTSSTEPRENILQTLLKEFSDIAPDTCTRIARNCGSNVEKARKELKICQLMSMGFPYIEEKDCDRALEHCQGKTERAAAWLLELSETIVN